jgi:copper chaperone
VLEKTLNLNRLHGHLLVCETSSFRMAGSFINESHKKGEGCMATIKITGMSCQHCVMAVTKALSGVDGISNVKVSLEKGEASFDEAKPVDMSVIRERIKKAGFDVA